MFKFLMILTVLTSQSWAKSVDLRSDMSAVRYQGGRNTCSVFAATSLMEFLIKKTTGQALDLSEQYNYWSAKQNALTNNTLQFYAHIDGLAGFLAVDGYKYSSALETEWTYADKSPFQLNEPQCINTNQPDSTCFTGIPPANIKTLPYTIKPISIEREKIGEFILQQKLPVVMNIKWCYSAVDKNGDYRMPTTTELSQCAGHVITLVGYDSELKRFIFRNSWGSTWGNQGYGTIPEEYIVKHCEVCDNLKYLDQVNAEEREMLLNASRGTSGSLLTSGKAQ